MYIYIPEFKVNILYTLKAVYKSIKEKDISEDNTLCHDQHSEISIEHVEF